MNYWREIDTCPEGVEVLTKIEDAHGSRNEQRLARFGRMFFTDTTKRVYVYYAPTHWRPV